MNTKPIASFALLTLMTVVSSACDGNSRATASPLTTNSTYAPEVETESVEESRYAQALNNLKDTHELELRELRERHRLELERKDFQIERLTADHEREIAAMKDRHELEILDLKNTHDREVAELNFQISVARYLAGAAGATLVLTWGGYGIYRRRRRKAKTSETADWTFRKPPGSVTQ